ncbi:hypothetical protein [Virgibacillus senegalensis]|uniref:hypothetical protein n=1 Tax=Virgibacillus senegalensis TaxID=1499679 RepID=UPI0018FE45C5|nr:hypothetical protein [Virgibacillus senegalensis]
MTKLAVAVPDASIHRQAIRGINNERKTTLHSGKVLRLPEQFEARTNSITVKVCLFFA